MRTLEDCLLRARGSVDVVCSSVCVGLTTVCPHSTQLSEREREQTRSRPTPTHPHGVPC